MNNRSITLFLILTFLCMVGLSGCNTKNNLNISSNKISIYTSVYPMYDFASKIGKEKVEVVNIIPAGAEPHDWEPNPSDIRNVQKAKLFIYNGAGMEPWIDKVLENIDKNKTIIIETTKGLDLVQSEEEHNNHDHHQGHDPHVWLNPQYAKVQMESIKNALIKVDPNNKEYYENNFSENAKKLDQLDQEFKTEISKFSKKDIVVSHQAFGYLCQAYGLNQIAIEGLSAESEPSPARMAEITNLVREKDIKYIFFEELISPKTAQVIAKETGAATAVLNPIEGLSDKDVKSGKEYFLVMKENLEALKLALK